MGNPPQYGPPGQPSSTIQPNPLTSQHTINYFINPKINNFHMYDVNVGTW